MQDRFKELERRVATEEIDMRTWMREVTRIVMELPPEEWAYRFISRHFSIEEPNDEQYNLFMVWLTSGFREKEKERALRRYFMEKFSDEPDTATGTECRRYAAEGWQEIALTLGMDPARVPAAWRKQIETK